MAAPAIPVARFAERVSVKPGAIEILQPAEVLRRELIMRELRVRQMCELRVGRGSRT
jgi:hypothetical protein